MARIYSKSLAAVEIIATTTVLSTVYTAPPASVGTVVLREIDLDAGWTGVGAFLILRYLYDGVGQGPQLFISNPTMKVPPLRGQWTGRLVMAPGSTINADAHGGTGGLLFAHIVLSGYLLSP